MIPPVRWLRFRVNLARTLAQVDHLTVELLGFDWSDPEVGETRVKLDDMRGWIERKGGRAHQLPPARPR